MFSLVYLFLFEVLPLILQTFSSDFTTFCQVLDSLVFRSDCLQQIKSDPPFNDFYFYFEIPALFLVLIPI